MLLIIAIIPGWGVSVPILLGLAWLSSRSGRLQRVCESFALELVCQVNHEGEELCRGMTHSRLAHHLALLGLLIHAGYRRVLRRIQIKPSTSEGLPQTPWRWKRVAFKLVRVDAVLTQILLTVMCERSPAARLRKITVSILTGWCLVIRASVRASIRSVTL